MPEVFFVLNTEEETARLAGILAGSLSAPFVLALQGALGAGKTTLMRGLLRALGVLERVKSPTFSLVESYELPNRLEILHHFDLYRIENAAELSGIGFEDYFSSFSICCIEWAERASAWIQPDLTCTLTFLSDEKRELSLCSHTEKGSHCIHALMEHYASHS